MRLNEKIIHRDVLLSTVLTFIILVLLKILIVNVEYLNPIVQVFDDFQFTDIYYSEFKKTKTEIDTNIVLVNIGENNRLEIARQLDTIKSYKPKVIGIDASFKERKDYYGDSVLKAALSGKISVISVADIVYNDSNTSAFQIEGSNTYFERKGMEGYGNFLGEENQTVRYYAPFIQVGIEMYPAFTTQIIRVAAPDVYDALLKRKAKTEIINYQSNNFPTIDVKGFYNLTDFNFLRNKIVLMGYMGPDLAHKVFEDNLLTPLNKNYGGRTLPDKYGIEIHANILSMLLRHSYINEMPKIVIYILAFLICMLHMYVFIYLFTEHHKWFHVGAISLQIVSFALIVALSLVLFHRFNFKLEPTYIIVGVLLSIESLYFYEALVKILHRRFNFRSCFAQNH